MEKDTHLVNIYLKIHNKKTLTMDDLAYLAQYAPECLISLKYLQSFSLST